MAVVITPVEGFDAKRNVSTVTAAAADTITLDMSVQNGVFLTFPAGNVTIANPTNAAVGDELYLELKQDSVGSRLVTWGAAFKKNTTLTTAANAIDFVSFWYDGTNWIQTGNALNLA